MKAKLEFEEDDFPVEATELSKDIMQRVLDYFQSIYNNDMSVSFHHNKLLRLLICLKPYNLDMIIDSLLESVEFIVDTHDSNIEIMNDSVRNSFKKRDEALYHFWEYHCTANLLKDENLSFRKKTAYRFGMIHQISEHMLKREAYLLSAAFPVSTIRAIQGDINLTETIQMLL